MGASKRPKIMIIDSHALIHRAYHALPPLTTKSGEIIQALYGFLLVFFRALKEVKPDFVFATFDVRGPTFRHERFEAYKATRPKAPEELYRQIPLVRKALTIFGVPIFEKEGFEADDLIGTLVKNIKKTQVSPSPYIVILTGDLDTLQLVGPNTQVLALKRGVTDSVLYTEKEVKKRFGFPVKFLPDFKGLTGDPSDNIPGVHGIGEKTAAKLIKTFGTLENLYRELHKHTPKARALKPSVVQSLFEQEDAAMLSKALATIKTDVPIDFSLESGVFGIRDPNHIREFLEQYEFSSLLNRIPEILSQENHIRTTQTQTSQAQLLSDRRTETKQEYTVRSQIEKLYREGVLSDILYKVECDLIPILQNMRDRGIQIDEPYLRTLSQETAQKIGALTKEVIAYAGTEFNINSPAQLSKILFERLELSLKGIKKTPKGVTSTAAEELVKLQGAHPIIDKLLEYRELTKLKTTYIDALPKLVDPITSRIHTTFHQLGTATGRISSSDPNLQNIPVRTETGLKIRRAFVPQHGYVFFSADYSQMELRIAASIAHDTKMQKFFKEGKDIHTMTAAQIFNIPEHEVTSKMRTLAKTLNFGVLYGMGVRGFQDAARISHKEAKKFLDEYSNDFEGIAAYTETIKARVRESGYGETRLGRKRFIPEIFSSDPRLQRAGERIAINFPIQGLAADIMKLAMRDVHKITRQFKDSIFMVLQVHDELLFEVQYGILHEAIPSIRDAMEHAYELEVPLKVGLKTGPNWADLSPF